MSDKNLPATVLTDLSAADQALVDKFVEDGLPGLVSFSDEKLRKACELYIEDRKTYRQISQALFIPLEAVLFLAQKGDWYRSRLRLQAELQSNISARLVEAKLASKDQLLELIQFFQKKFKKKIRKFDNIEQDDIELNLKEVDRFYKALELLNKLNSDGKDKNGKTPALGLNVGDGVTVTKKDDNSFEITPTQQTVGDMLEKLANVRRAAANKKSENSSDIKVVQETVTDGEGDKE